MSLEPTERVLKVDSENASWLPPNSVTVESVGHKARGLSCLPPLWTLPFLVISSDLLDAYREIKRTERKSLIGRWSERIRHSAVQAGLSTEDSILVRSSAVTESLEHRGRYHSTSGRLDNLSRTLETCLDQLANDEDLNRSRIHLIVQKEVKPDSGKGHLSNERHCYEEARDWLGQFEGPDLSERETFSINLRNWRRREKAIPVQSPLDCNLKALVSTMLRLPAWWGYQKNARLHFEWVWDGNRLFIVQADEAKTQSGIDPTTDPDLNKRPAPSKRLTVLQPISDAHARNYHKIKNVYTYLKLQLPSTDLYVLDNPAILERVRKGSVSKELMSDLEALTSASLVIRTDLATSEKDKRQLLPRTNEVRDAATAVHFMQATLEHLRANNVVEQVAFVFHNFIPAVASAFAYAAPGQRKVWIEALWGLPEGLYYNAHDKIEVDTLSPDVSRVTPDRMERLAITKRPRFKRYFVAPDVRGNWVIKNVAEPWDWRLSIPKDEWIKQIAIDSRRIAEEDGQPLSIMWFIGVPNWASPSPIFPWHHEPFDLSLVGQPQASRRKTPFDQSHLVRTREDIELLRREASSPTSRIRQIRIQPSEEPLLRDKDLLRKIGELAKQIDAVILLEGATLSHAYYQLMQTGAIVEVVHAFEGRDEKREFNKLVRDGIPDQISRGGESVRVSKLAGELLLRALREKLVEESFEALEAPSQTTIIEELADVQEVLDAVVAQLGVSRREVAKQQKAKRLKSGGFEQGYVLVDTTNPSPDKSISDEATLPLGLKGGGAFNEGIVEQTSAHLNAPILARWVDKREHPSASEQILKLLVTLVRDKWSAESTEIELGADTGDVIRARIEGVRKGAVLHLEVSVYIPPRQLKLLK